MTAKSQSEDKTQRSKTLQLLQQRIGISNEWLENIEQVRIATQYTCVRLGT